MPAVSLSCSRCRRLAARLTLPRIPETMRGFVGGVLTLANAKLRSHGVTLAVPASGEITDAIPAEQLPAVVVRAPDVRAAPTLDTADADGARAALAAAAQHPDEPNATPNADPGATSSPETALSDHAESTRDRSRVDAAPAPPATLSDETAHPLARIRVAIDRERIRATRPNRTGR